MKALIAQRPDGSAAIILPAPVECPRCHRMAQFVVNRDGRTLCLNCDDVNDSRNATLQSRKDE